MKRNDDVGDALADLHSQSANPMPEIPYPRQRNSPVKR